MPKTIMNMSLNLMANPLSYHLNFTWKRQGRMYASKELPIAPVDESKIVLEKTSKGDFMKHVWY